jgi:GNAT superfamily N-acetyltransferase
VEDQLFINGMDKRDGMILFRHLGDNVPDAWIKDFRWQVEYHGSHDPGYPLGLAWVFAPPPGKTYLEDMDHQPWIMFIFVVDGARRTGIGTKLIQAIKDRWPDVKPTPAISDEGAALIRKIRKS